MNNFTGIFGNSALGVYLVFKPFQIIINGFFFLINANGGGGVGEGVGGGGVRQIGTAMENPSRVFNQAAYVFKYQFRIV